MTKTKISTILTSLILLVALCFTMVACGLNPDDGKNSEITTETEGTNTIQATALKTNFVNTENVKLMAASELSSRNAERSMNMMSRVTLPRLFPVTSRRK